MISSKTQQRKIDMGKTHEDDEIEIDLMELFYALKNAYSLSWQSWCSVRLRPVLILSFW